jgi:hypothetical protein
VAEIATGPDTRICERCGSSVETVDGLPSACPLCERTSVPDDYGLRDTRFPVKVEFETDGMYRHYRTQGLTEPQALEALERDDRLRSSIEGVFPMNAETPEGANRIVVLVRRFFRTVLKKNGVLDAHPVGWNEEENGKLGKAMEFEDVVWRVSQIMDVPREKIVVGTLLSAQGHLAPLLRAIGPAIHGIFQGPRWAAGKSHAAKALTLLGGGKWFDAATPAFIKSARRDGPCILGIDEGDEAEKENPGLKGILLESHNWDAHYGKFSDPDSKGKRGPEAVAFGGPIFITFRAKPWPAVASRGVLFEMERSKNPRVSDEGAVMEKVLAPCVVWLRERCIVALRDKNELWAQLRIAEADFLERLDRISNKGPSLRSRDKARSLLLISELLGIDLEREIAATIQEEEDESENESIIEAILSDPAVIEGREIPSEELRLNLQKRLKDAREPVNLTRNRLAAVLAEIGWVKDSDMWKRTRYEGRITTVLFPAVYKAAHPERFV